MVALPLPFVLCSGGIAIGFFLAILLGLGGRRATPTTVVVEREPGPGASAGCGVLVAFILMVAFFLLISGAF
jgi:hypothetical protein